MYVKSTTGGGDGVVKSDFFLCKGSDSCSAWARAPVQRWGPQSGACYRAEFDVSVHQLRDAKGECCQLLMDIHEEGVRAPAAHLTDLDVTAFV